MALTNDGPNAEKILCDNCESDDAAIFRCSDCGIFLCQFCVESHKRSRSTKHHELLTMEELKSNPGPQKIAEKVRCPKHKEEVIKLFCKTCQTTICRDCTIVDHRQHEYGFVEEVVDEKKQHLQSNLDEVKQRKGRVVDGIVNLKKFNESLETNKKSAISEINQHFDQFVKAVESRRTEMVEQATSVTNSKQKQMYAQLEVLEVALASCDSSIEFTERAFKNGNDVQILSMEKYILQSLEQLKAVKDQTKPCVSKDVKFIIPPSEQQTKEKLLNEYHVVDVAVASPGNCQTSFKEKEEKFDAGKQYSISLICHDKDNQRLRCGGQEIKPSFTGMEISDVVVTDNEDGCYAISFCPRQGGMLKFEVSINGVPAPNCSLAKQVKWVISDAHGKGVITAGGRTMKGVGREGEYCWRVGRCYFESGVHTWRVQLSYQDDYGLGMGMSDQHRFNSASFFGNSSWSLPHQFNPVSSSVEVGIISYDEINTDISQSQKWVHKLSLNGGNNVDVSFTLDMEKGTLDIKLPNIWGSASVYNCQFTACRVSPFFACSSPVLSISLVE